MGKALTMLLVALLAHSCGTASGDTTPTADIQLSSARQTPARVMATAPTSTLAPTLAAVVPATAMVVATAAPSDLADPLAQYRAWIAEARDTYPYPQPAEAMWAVMICESSGDPTSSNGQNYGLFQYDAATWAGEWNPYRDQPILDPHAQIFATAKAWHDGNQHWWGCQPS